MELRAQYIGDWSDYHGNYRWQSLMGGDHTALGDARATRDLLQSMAAALAGHEKADTTANIYSDADMDRKRAALKQAS